VLSIILDFDEPTIIVGFFKGATLANEQPAKKKRRIRPSNQTVREQTQLAKAESVKDQPTKKRRAVFGKVLAPLNIVFRPLRWLGRHIIPRYLRNSFAELRNVTWINRKQSRQLTTAVVLFAIVFGALVSVLDLGLDKVFKKVFLKE